MKFIAEHDSLTIKFEMMERFFAFKKELVLAKSDTTDMTFASQFVNRDRKLRVGGTGLPWLLAGRFRDIDSKELLFLYINHPKLASLTGGFRAENVLVVTLSSGKYAQVLVTCRPDIATQIVSWWQA